MSELVEERMRSETGMDKKVSFSKKISNWLNKDKKRNKVHSEVFDIE